MAESQPPIRLEINETSPESFSHNLKSQVLQRATDGAEDPWNGLRGGDSGLQCPGSACVICPGQLDLQDSPSHPPVYRTINSLYTPLMLQTGSEVSDFSAQVSIKCAKECYTFANQDGAVHEGGHTGYGVICSL